MTHAFMEQVSTLQLGSDPDDRSWGQTPTIGAMTHAFMEQVAALQLGSDPDDQQLADVARLMLAWAGSPGALPAELLALPRATGQQELLYPLHVAPGAPALYLVSDGPGVASPPHHHATWAVIVGLSGNERNALYERDSICGTLHLQRTVDIQANDMIHLRADTIHATVALDDQPTFHLHLYGKPLHELPPYASRCHPLTLPALP